VSEKEQEGVQEILDNEILFNSIINDLFSNVALTVDDDDESQNESQNKNESQKISKNKLKSFLYEFSLNLNIPFPKDSDIEFIFKGNKYINKDEFAILMKRIFQQILNLLN